MSKTEVWFRNPHNYARELVEANYGWVAWDRGLLQKRRVDPVAHAELFFGKAIPFRVLIVGEQGTAELGSGRNMQKPLAVYPTWQYGEEQSLLEEIVEFPVGQDEKICSDKSVEPDQRPVFGQEHRVVIINPPDARHMGGRAFYRYLKQLQEDHPSCIIHLHGSYSYRMMFGMGYAACDADPRTQAGLGKLTLPSGKTVPYEQGMNKPKWFAATGFLPVDMQVPRNRCIFNIKSALWAGENYNDLQNFSLQMSSNTDSLSTKSAFEVKQVKPQKLGKGNPGDKIVCDSCSLSNKCKYERAGAVCSVPGEEMSSLGKYFRTRDSASIMDGLSELMVRNTRRLESGIESEEDLGELDPEVTKVMGQVFDQGTKLAKLVDPSLRGAKVAVNVLQTGGGAGQAYTNPKEMLASAVRELEHQGIKREDITPAMIEGMLAGMADQGARNRAIEGIVISEENG